MCRSFAGSSSFGSQQMLFQNAGPMTTLRVGLVLRMTASASASSAFHIVVHRAVRLVEDLEHHLVRRVLVALGHLRPERQHQLAAARRVLVAALVVVLVEDHVEILLDALRRPARRGSRTRSGASTSFSFICRKPYRLMRTVSKPPSLMILKCRGLKRPLRGVLPQRVVAHDVHAALHLRDLVGGERAFPRRATPAGRVPRAACQSQRMFIRALIHFFPNSASSAARAASASPRGRRRRRPPSA